MEGLPDLRVTVSTKLEDLLERIFDDLQHARATGAARPFEPELIVVPSQGVRRWLTHRLADRFGIAASLDTPFLARFFERLIEAVDGRPAADPDPLDAVTLGWRIHRRLADPAAGRGAAALTTYLRGDAEHGVRRAQLAAAVAERFLEYRALRPEVLAAWETDRPSPTPLGAAQEHEDWQRALWRDLVRATPAASAAPLATLPERLLASTDPPGLAGAVHLFGFGTLPHHAIRVLFALAHRCPVRIHLTAPTIEYWADVRRRRRDPVDEHVHDLLATLGARARETHELLLRADPDDEPVEPLDSEALAEPEDLEGGTLLAAIQHDLRRALARPAGSVGVDRRLDATAFADDDTLLAVACHGPMREMEVIRDRILAAFAADPSLRPDDVAILVPDVTLYAPLAEAAFQMVARDDAAPWMLSIADRGAAGNATAGAFRALLELVRARGTAAEVLDLLEFDALRGRAAIAADEVEAARALLAAGAVAWGIDGAHRGTDHRVPPIDIGTFRFGVDRLLLGHAIGATHDASSGDPKQLVDLPTDAGATRPWLPAGDATCGRADLLGRLTLWLGDLLDALRELREPRPLTEWSRRLVALVVRFVDAGADPAAWTRLRDAVATLADADRIDPPAVDTDAEPIPFAALRAALDTRIDTAFAAGLDFPGRHVTLCALQPARTVPFRMLCVAGLGEGTFPRSARELAFDVVRAAPRPGDRSAPADDRLLFLETLLAARDRLVLTWIGRSPRDNSQLPPSTCVATLFDQLDRTLVEPADSGFAAPHRRVCVDAPLQPFSSRHFDGREPRLQGFSADDAAAARPTARDLPLPAFVPDAPALPSAGNGDVVVDLDALVRFWEGPAVALCRDLLGIRFPDDGVRLADSETLDPDGLTAFLVRTALDQHGLDDPRVTIALQHAGLAPAGAIGAHWIDVPRTAVATWRAARGAEPPFASEAIDVVVPLPGGRARVTGAIDGFAADALISGRPAKCKPKDQVAALVRHVFATLAAVQRGDPPPASRLVAVDRVVELRKLDGDDDVERALAVARGLVHGWQLGREGRLPFEPEIAAEFVAKGPRAARRKWAAPRDRFNALDAHRKPAPRLVWRDRAPVDAEPAGRFAECAELVFGAIDAWMVTRRGSK